MLDSPSEQHRVLVIGAAGMLGHTMLRYLAASPGFEVVGTTRDNTPPKGLSAKLGKQIISNIDANDAARLLPVLRDFRPHAVINCAGLVKQREEAQTHEAAIISNALLPHRLARLCSTENVRLIHLSTDCVFSGQHGYYREDDLPDCTDLYGRTKLLGEVSYDGALTLRTSIIGHELTRGLGLVSWFLAQTGSVKGYTNAIFSGLPTVELAHVIRDYVLPNRSLRGLLHLASDPISKHDLLVLIREAYGTEIDIVRDDSVKINRSLDASRFRHLTHYAPPVWPELIAAMKAFG